MSWRSFEALLEPVIVHTDPYDPTPLLDTAEFSFGARCWFQLQSSTFVGLNTSRPERTRTDTLRSLNALGRDLRVEFDPGLLHMNESGDQADVVASKIEGLRAFTRAGYRPVAVVDHDPAEIRAMVDADETGDILFLHTRTTSPSPRLTGPRTATGRHRHFAAMRWSGARACHTHLAGGGRTADRSRPSTTRRDMSKRAIADRESAALKLLLAFAPFALLTCGACSHRWSRS